MNTTDHHDLGLQSDITQRTSAVLGHAVVQSWHDIKGVLNRVLPRDASVLRLHRDSVLEALSDEWNGGIDLLQSAYNNAKEPSALGDAHSGVRSLGSVCLTIDQYETSSPERDSRLRRFLSVLFALEDAIHSAHATILDTVACVSQEHFKVRTALPSDIALVAHMKGARGPVSARKEAVDFPVLGTSNHKGRYGEFLEHRVPSWLPLAYVQYTSPYQSDVLEITNLHVPKVFRRQGHGTALLSHVIDNAQHLAVALLQKQPRSLVRAKHTHANDAFLKQFHLQRTKKARYSSYIETNS